VRENVAKEPSCHTDGWTGYDDLEALGYVHKPLVLMETQKESKPISMIHIAFSNLKVMVARNPPRR